MASRDSTVSSATCCISRTHGAWKDEGVHSAPKPPPTRGVASPSEGGRHTGECAERSVQLPPLCGHLGGGEHPDHRVARRRQLVRRPGGTEGRSTYAIAPNKVGERVYTSVKMAGRDVPHRVLRQTTLLPKGVPDRGSCLDGVPQLQEACDRDRAAPVHKA